MPGAYPIRYEKRLTLIEIADQENRRYERVYDPQPTDIIRLANDYGLDVDELLEVSIPKDPDIYGIVIDVSTFPKAGG